MDKIHLPCVILCGGKSSRMKSNKAILPFGDYKLISHQVIKLSKIFSHLAISLKESKKDEILDMLRIDIEKYNANNPPIDLESIDIIIEDSTYFSPLFGILNCFDTLEMGKIFVIPIDCPFVRFKTMSVLSNNSNNYDVIYAKDSTQIHPLIGIWKANIKDKIAISLKENKFKILDFLSSCDTKSIYFDANEFINLNTKQDYKNALKILKE